MIVTIRNLQETPVNLDRLQAVAQAAAAMVSLHADHLIVVLVDDDYIHDINLRFRGLNHPTDVIAFEPEPEAEELAGEIIISVETAQRQATEAGHDLDAELAWLVAHGVLHVAGMNDGTEAELQDMLNLQRQILSTLGL